MTAQRRRPARAYLGLGANLGDRESNLREALRRLQGSVRVLRVAGLYETEPVGVREQPWFLNTVAKVETALEPAELLGVTRRIEREMGRAPGPKGEPRPIDIDILLWGRQVVQTGDVTIPHPRLHERRFVLAPLAELASRRWHPILKKSVARLLREAPTDQALRRAEWSRAPL